MLTLTAPLTTPAPYEADEFDTPYLTALGACAGGDTSWPCGDGDDDDDDTADAPAERYDMTLRFGNW